MAINIPEIKPGVKSTEFLLSIIGIVLILYGMYVGFVPQELGMTLITTILGLYGIQRTLLKKEQLKTARNS